jgi:hypothetical protein
MTIKFSESLFTVENHFCAIQLTPSANRIDRVVNNLFANKP